VIVKAAGAFPNTDPACVTRPAATGQRHGSVLIYASMHPHRRFAARNELVQGIFLGVVT
jgi:hypothetical protein